MRPMQERAFEKRGKKYLQRTPHGAPIALNLPSAGPNSLAVCDQVQVIAKRRLRDAFGAVSGRDLKNIENSVRFILRL
jgi:mRNA-degrading endonuclease toxin of MazEF toxin-antitoxin module